MFFLLFTILINSALNEVGIEQELSWGWSIRNTEFRNINGKPAIKLNQASNKMSYAFYVEYCYFNSCSGSRDGPTIFVQAPCVPNIRFNCIYNCHTSTDSDSCGVLYIQTNDNTAERNIIQLRMQIFEVLIFFEDLLLKMYMFYSVDTCMRI